MCRYGIVVALGATVLKARPIRVGTLYGNITALSLPGGFLFSYTGMEVRNVNDSRFHGIGIVPDVTVPVTAADLRDGIDRDLLAALDILMK